MAVVDILRDGLGKASPARMLTLPAILFGLATALLAGAAYHVLRGGSGGRLLFDLGMSTLGFMLGHFSQYVSGWILFEFGTLDLGAGVVGSILFLVFGDWLSRIKPNPKSGV